MSSNWQKAGANHVPAYQMSGIPFVTSSVPNEVHGPHGNGVSTPIEVKFPYVTKFITVRNTGAVELGVGFSADGVVEPGARLASEDTDKSLDAGRNYFMLSPTDDAGTAGSDISIQTFEVRCTSIFFLAAVDEDNDPTANGTTSFSLLAGLTTIPAGNFPILTASNGFLGVG